MFRVRWNKKRRGCRGLVAPSRAAFFDIDGTLMRGLLIVDLPTYLARRGLFNERLSQKILELAESYRRGQVSYRHISTRIPYLYAQGIRGQSRSEVCGHADRFIHRPPRRLFSYSRRLVGLMAERGFLTVAVSGSPIEVVSPLRELGFREVFGTEMETRGGRYTGRVVRNLILAEEKKKLVASLIARHHVDISRSWAFGDTEQDLPMWRTVGNPVVLNPSPRLRAYAIRNGWLVPRQVLKEVRVRLPLSKPSWDPSSPRKGNSSLLLRPTAWHRGPGSR